MHHKNKHLASWFSFSTARRRENYPSHFEQSLNPTSPGLPLCVFGRFRAMAYLPCSRLA